MSLNDKLIAPEQVSTDVPSGMFAIPTPGQLDVTLATLDSKKVRIISTTLYVFQCLLNKNLFWCTRIHG